MAAIDFTGTLVPNPQAPKFASNQASGGRTLFPLKFTPDVIRNGSEAVGTVISGSTYPCTTQKTGPIAEGIKAYAASILLGGSQPWGYIQSFPSPKTKNAVINLQWSVFFPLDYNWDVTSGSGGRLKFMRIPRKCMDFKYIKCTGCTGTVPTIGATITQGGVTGLFAGLTATTAVDTVSPSVESGTAIPTNVCMRLTNIVGTFVAGTLSGGGMAGTVPENESAKDGEGHIDLYIENTAFSGALRDGQIKHDCEGTGGIVNGVWTDTNTNLVKGQWETIEIRVVLDPLPMSSGGTARTQLWRRIGQQMTLVLDIQNQSTINRDTSVCTDFVLFNYWNGNSPATQDCYLDRMVMHFNPASMVETCPTTGVKIIGGVSP